VISADTGLLFLAGKVDEEEVEVVVEERGWVRVVAWTAVWQGNEQYQQRHKVEAAWQRRSLPPTP